MHTLAVVARAWSGAGVGGDKGVTRPAERPQTAKRRREGCGQGRGRGKNEGKGGCRLLSMQRECCMIEMSLSVPLGT